MSGGPPGGPAPHPAGAALAGALAAGILAAVIGFVLARIAPRAADGFRDFLTAGGWLWIPAWGAAAGLLGTLGRTGTRRARWGVVALAFALLALPAVLRPEVLPEPEKGMPVTASARTRAIRKWAYRSPADVRRIVTLSHDPDPVIREQAMLALGVNRVVDEARRAGSPAPHAAVLGALRTRLEQALGDTLVAIRAEAARALWRTPAAFGPQPAAAETLAAVLDRAHRPDADPRLGWLALDAALAHRDAALDSAIARFARATPDIALADAARRALTRRSH